MEDAISKVREGFAALTVSSAVTASGRLALHPIAGLISTIVGASPAGLLGATLSTPVVATVMRISSRLRGREQVAVADAPEQTA